MTVITKLQARWGFLFSHQSAAICLKILVCPQFAEVVEAKDNTMAKAPILRDRVMLY